MATFKTELHDLVQKYGWPRNYINNGGAATRPTYDVLLDTINDIQYLQQKMEDATSDTKKYKEDPKNQGTIGPDPYPG